MKLHLLASIIIGILAFFIGIFTAAALIDNSVHKAVFDAFETYTQTHGSL